ncbi:MAG: hypothetical protein Q9162_000295 [Coniocarpon cinnabarinum]
MAAQSHRGIHTLSNELLREVLNHIEADPDKLVTLDRRAYLSQESFKPPTFPSPDQAHDLGNFRLACRRFSDLGAVHQYARVTVRFSRHGLARLDWLAERPHLAQHVKKFSYMVPYFYAVGGRTGRDLRHNLPSELDFRHFTNKVAEQDAIKKSQYDVKVLQKAFLAFIHLCHIQILRLQDYEDGILLHWIRSARGRLQVIEPRWHTACFHSTKTIGAALLSSSSPCSRFSSPMLSIHSAKDLERLRPRDLPLLVQRLTSLELHFDDSNELDQRMHELSSLFRHVLSAAENMQAIHIGFPSHYPLSLPLEDLFHHIRWKNLIAFGIQAWKLNADEIISLVRRHRDKLRGLRLRDVLLKRGSRWKDVLQVLRAELSRLEWVSLRRIGYADRFDEQMADIGIEIEDIPGGDSESGDEDEVLSLSEMDTQSSHTADGDDDDNEIDENDNEENGPHTNEMSFPHLLDHPRRWCYCNGQQVPSAEDLGDDGISVTNPQRKLWERWCIRRCSHDVGRCQN